MKYSQIVIHAEGCCQPNPGHGGCAAVITYFENGTEVWRTSTKNSAKNTTNNQMKLLAVIDALNQVPRDETAPITIVSNAKYVVDGMNNDLSLWQANGWQTTSGKMIKNQLLWKKLHCAKNGRNVHCEGVYGKNCNERLNEAKSLAKEAASRK